MTKKNANYYTLITVVLSMIIITYIGLKDIALWRPQYDTFILILIGVIIALISEVFLQMYKPIQTNFKLNSPMRLPKWYLNMKARRAFVITFIYGVAVSIPIVLYIKGHSNQLVGAVSVGFVGMYLIKSKIIAILGRFYSWTIGKPRA
ncbi:MAG: hypothetical protein ACR2MX_11825 [Cyclobacteriaceae bacterium]